MALLSLVISFGCMRCRQPPLSMDSPHTHTQTQLASMRGAIKRESEKYIILLSSLANNGGGGGRCFPTSRGCFTERENSLACSSAAQIHIDEERERAIESIGEKRIYISCFALSCNSQHPDIVMNYLKINETIEKIKNQRKTTHSHSQNREVF